MIESANSQSDVPPETSNPNGAASLESILCTEDLHNRQWRPPDHQEENSALVALTSAFANSPRTILQTLADKVLEVLHANSAGLSLLTKDEKNSTGELLPARGGHTPAVAPHAILGHAAMCSTTIFRCYSLIGNNVTHICARRCLLPKRDCLFLFT